MRFALIAVALLALAGCLDGNSSTDTPDNTGEQGSDTPLRYELPEDPMPEGAGHDHTDPDAHKFLWNYTFESRDPMMQNAAMIAGVHALDLKGDYLYGAVYGANAAGVNGGLAIWSLADPNNPELTGEFRVPGAVGGDRSMEVTDDGNFAVLGTEPVTCFGQVNPVPVDIYLIDTSDKSLPVVADVITTTGTGTADPSRVSPSLGEHSVTVHNFDGRDYAFIFGQVFEITNDEILGGQLVDTGVSVSTGHDLYLRDTPWGDVWALVANGGGGLNIYNVTNPLNPVEIGTWNLPDRGSLAEEYYFHTADVAFFPDGDIVVILTSEDWLDWVSPMWILDGKPLRNFTDESIPLEHTGVWWNPGNHTALGTSFSLHNPRFHEEGILTLSSYHGGLWQLDFRDPSLRSDPAEIAYAVYADGEQTLVQDPISNTIENSLCGLGLTLDAPTYMDVEYGPAGHLYAADVYMGLYAFAPTAEHLVYGWGDMGEGMSA